LQMRQIVNLFEINGLFKFMAAAGFGKRFFLLKIGFIVLLCQKKTAGFENRRFFYKSPCNFSRGRVK